MMKDVLCASFFYFEQNYVVRFQNGQIKQGIPGSTNGWPAACDPPYLPECTTITGMGALRIVSRAVLPKKALSTAFLP